MAGQLEGHQPRSNEYVELRATPGNRLAVEDREERGQVIHGVLSQAKLNQPKMHVLSHYSSDIKDCVCLAQYSTVITEALHKPLKDTYRRSNQVDEADQIFDAITREHTICMGEFHIQACSREVQFGDEIQDLVNNPADKQATNAADPSSQLQGFEGSRWQNERVPEQEAGTHVDQVPSGLMLPQLSERF